MQIAMSFFPQANLESEAFHTRAITLTRSRSKTKKDEEYEYEQEYESMQDTSDGTFAQSHIMAFNNTMVRLHTCTMIRP